MKKDKTLTIVLIEFKYCPLCGKGLFKQYVDFKELNEYSNDRIYHSECNKCKSLITIELKGRQNNEEREK